MEYEQFSLNDYFFPAISIDKPIRLLEFFSGIGATAMGLRNLGVPFEHYRTCEWEIHAIAAYHQIHMGEDTTDYSKGMNDEELIKWLTNKGISANGKIPLTEDQIRTHKNGSEWRRRIYNDIQATHNLVNIMQVKGEDLGITDKDKHCYILTWSFPCTDLSQAGKQKGMEEGSGTASSLAWEVIRILKETTEKPDILLMENVSAVHSEKFIDGFTALCEELEKIGYMNQYDDLNAKDYGVAQNRERCFMISTLGKYNYKFPVTIPLRRTMNDYLDDVVDEKYYIHTPKAQELIVDLQERGQLETIAKTVRGGD